MDTENSIFNTIMRRTISRLRQLAMFETPPQQETPSGDCDCNVSRYFDVTVTSVEQSATRSTCSYSSSDHDASNGSSCDEDLPHYNVYRSEATPNTFWRKSDNYSEYRTRRVHKQICSKRMSVSCRRTSASSILSDQSSNRIPSTDTVVIELGDDDIDECMGNSTKFNRSDQWSNESFNEYCCETRKSNCASFSTIKIMVGDDSMDSSISCSSDSSDEYYCKKCQQQYSFQHHCEQRCLYKNRYYRHNVGRTNHQYKPAAVAPKLKHEPPVCGTPIVPQLDKGDKIHFTGNSTQVIAKTEMSNQIQLGQIQGKESSVVFRESTDATMRSNTGDGMCSRVKYHKKLRHSACFMSESSQSELFFESYSESTVRSMDSEIWEPLRSSEQLSRDIKKVIQNNPQFLIRVQRKRANSCDSMLPSPRDEDISNTQSATSLTLRNKHVSSSCSSPLITERATPLCRPLGHTVVSWCSHQPDKKCQSAHCEPEGNKIHLYENIGNENMSKEEAVVNYDMEESGLIRENMEKSPDLQTLDEPELESETGNKNITVKDTSVPQTSIVRENLEIYENISAVLAMNRSNKVLSTLGRLEKKESKETNYVAEKCDIFIERAPDVWSLETKEPELEKDLGKESDQISTFDIPTTTTGVDRNNTDYKENRIRTHLEKLFGGATEVKTLEKLYTTQKEKIARKPKLPNQSIIKGKVTILQNLTTLKEYSSSSANSLKPRNSVVKLSSHDRNNARTSDTQNRAPMREQAKRYIGNPVSKLRQSKVVCYGIRRLRNVRNNMIRSIDNIRTFVSREQSKNCLVIEDMSMFAIQQCLCFQIMSDNILYPDIRIDEGRYKFQININKKVVKMKLKTNIKFKVNIKIKLKKVEVNQNICFKKYQMIDHKQILDSLISFRLNGILCALFSVRKILNKAMEENDKRTMAIGLDKNANTVSFPQLLIRVENNFHLLNVDQFYSNFEGQSIKAMSLKSEKTDGLDKNANTVSFPQLLIKVQNNFHLLNVDQFYSNFEGQSVRAMSLKSEKTEHSNSFTQSDPGTMDIQLRAKLSQFRRTLWHCLESYIQTIPKEFNCVGSLETTSKKIIQEMTIQVPSDCFQFYITEHYLETRVISFDCIGLISIRHSYHPVNNLTATIYNPSIAEEEPKSFTIISEENKDEHNIRTEGKTISSEKVTFKSKQPEETISNSGRDKPCEENKELITSNGHEDSISTKDNAYIITNEGFKTVVFIEENEDSITTEDNKQRITAGQSETAKNVLNEDSLRKECNKLETNISYENVHSIRSKGLSHSGKIREIKKSKRRYLRRMSSHCERDREFALRRRLIMNKIRKTKTANRIHKISQEQLGMEDV